MGEADVSTDQKKIFAENLCGSKENLLLYLHEMRKKSFSHTASP